MKTKITEDNWLSLTLDYLNRCIQLLEEDRLNDSKEEIEEIEELIDYLNKTN